MSNPKSSHQDIFNIESQWHKYLELVRLDEDKMPVDQRSETRRAFFGGMSQMFIVMEQIPESPGQGIMLMMNVKEQLTRFWTSEEEKYNAWTKKGNP